MGEIGPLVLVLHLQSVLEGANKITAPSQDSFQQLLSSPGQLHAVFTAMELCSVDPTECWSRYKHTSGLRACH